MYHKKKTIPLHYKYVPMKRNYGVLYKKQAREFPARAFQITSSFLFLFFTAREFTDDVRRFSAKHVHRVYG